MKQFIDIISHFYQFYQLIVDVTINSTAFWKIEKSREKEFKVSCVFVIEFIDSLIERKYYHQYHLFEATKTFQFICFTFH